MDFSSTWFANTNQRFMSLGCCAIVQKTLSTETSSSRKLESESSSSRVSGSASSSDTGGMRGVIVAAYGDPVATIEYDEFGLFHENASEAGLPFDDPPVVARVEVEVAPGQRVSALRWGTGDPELVLLHGGAQNAHTWDTVALALGRPLLAIDLPGHGRSDWRATRRTGRPRTPAPLRSRSARSRRTRLLVVGMSLGGLTALALATEAPELVRRLLLVDVTPGVDREKASAVVSFIAGPESFATFDEILDRTVLVQPDPLGLVVAARHPAQRGRAARRHLGVAV